MHVKEEVLMPIYEFECKTCKAATEVIQSHKAAAPACPTEPEHGSMAKKISLGSFAFEGGSPTSSTRGTPPGTRRR